MSINSILSALLILFTFFFVFLLYYSWQKREHLLANVYGLGVLSAFFYTFGYAFQLMSTTVYDMLFWIRIQYLGIPFSAVIWVVIIMYFTGKQNLLTKKTIGLLAIGPLFTLSTHFTNGWHHLFYRSMGLDYSYGFPLIDLNRGPFFYVHIIFLYSYYLIGVCLLVQMLFKANRERKKHSILMLSGSFFVFGVPLIHSVDIFNIPFDISPFGLIIAGLYYIWAIYQFNLFNLSPIAMKKGFDSIQDGVIILDLHNHLNSYNKSASYLFESLPEKPRLGHDASAIFSHLPSFLQIIEKDITTDDTIEHQVTLANERHYQVHYSIVTRGKNKALGKILILKDITENVQYETNLVSQSKQLAELNHFKDNMFRIVAHDIRDPLAVLVNLMELMEEDLQDKEWTIRQNSHLELVGEMSKQIRNTFTLVENLLEWFASQRSGMLFNPVERDIAKVVESTIDTMKIKINNKNITVSSTIPSCTYVYADKDMLDLIVRNLLSNALKFTYVGGTITFSSQQLKDKIIVSISDTGQGMTHDEAKILLQDSLPSSKKGTAGEQGVGLGLSICKEFVRLNGGDIWFDSSANVGTIFYFSLPISLQTYKVHEMKEVVV